MFFSAFPRRRGFSAACSSIPILAVLVTSSSLAAQITSSSTPEPGAAATSPQPAPPAPKHQLAGPLDCNDLSESPCPKPPPGFAGSSGVETSLSLGAFAQFTPTRLQNNKNDGILLSTQTQGVAPTAGVLGTVRQQFRPLLGYSLNMGYTRVDERYLLPSSSLPAYNNDLHLANNFYELSLSYVAEKHLTPRLSGFADLGAGFTAFLPIDRGQNSALQQYGTFHPSVNFRPLGVTGFGVDLLLSTHLAFRAEYRGLFYKNPDFGSLQKSTTWSSEPTLSLVYRPRGTHSYAHPRLAKQKSQP